jgi:Protein of unknown function (DUF3048) N-terminal domain/Protein of unknown function (DUF3048) C-terminal domain
MALRGRTIVMTTASAVVVAALGATVAVLLASHSPPPKKVHQALPSASPSPTATPRRRGPLTSPFTGWRVHRLNRVLAVKIDNIVFARPQTGLTRADIVYVIPVEGGLSRFLAIFSSHVPPVIGPVRSARQTDVKLLRQFGRPAFAFSGATPWLLRVLEHKHFVSLYAGITGGYYRNNSRIAPYNLYASPRTLLREARQRASKAGQHVSKARDIGFRFGPRPPGAHVRRKFSISYPAASFTFRWSSQRHRWLVWMDGARAETTDRGQLRPATVVIEYTRVGTSKFLERGIRPPFAFTVGSGRALVLRNGMIYRAAWSRPHADGGTKFTLPSGKRMTFARGQVWVVLASRNGTYPA